MYIDIGGNKSLRSSKIVAVMDIETASTSKKTKEFLRIAGKTATEVSDELPRTFIIAKEKKNIKIYVSPVSVQTLYRRVKSGNSVKGMV